MTNLHYQIKDTLTERQMVKLKFESLCNQIKRKWPVVVAAITAAWEQLAGALTAFTDAYRLPPTKNDYTLGAPRD